MTTNQDDFYGTNGNWNTPGSWSDNTGPATTQDAFIGDLASTTVTTTTNEVVNSIGTTPISALDLGETGVANITFTASNGTVLNNADTSHFGTGNVGEINVAAGSNLVIGNSFTNYGTLLVGLGASRTSSGSANLKLVGTVTLTGNGTVDLGAPGSEQLGNILNDTGGDGLTNVNNTIQGVGTIGLADFDNESGAKVTAQGGEFDTLQVYATSNWTNSGTYTAASNNYLDLGKDGTTTTLTNNGSIELDGGHEGGGLKIAGNFTLTGSGAMAFKGAGAAITSDGSAATLINGISIYAIEFGGQIGADDSHLTFDNDGGSVQATEGQTITLNTGSTTDTDDGGGSFLAENGGSFVIDSPVITGGTEDIGDIGRDIPGGGTIEAETGGTVEINAPVSPGSGGVFYQDGQVLIDGFASVSLGVDGSVSSPVNFSGSGGILHIDNAATVVSGAMTMNGGDFLDLIGMPFVGAQANWVENGGGTAGTLTVSNGSKTETFNINGDYTTSSFGLFNDGIGSTEIGVPNAAAPSDTTAVMVMSDPSDEAYEIYDVGGNAIQAAYSLGYIYSNFVGLGTFQAGDSSDMLFRNLSTGAFEAYYISGNTITGSALVGTVGVSNSNPSQNWAYAATGDFDGASSLSEILLWNGGAGAMELYHVAGGGVLTGSSVAAVGHNLSLSGSGDFLGNGLTQLVMEQAGAGPMGSNIYWEYTYNPSTAQFAGVQAGYIGSNLEVVGFGDLLGNGSSQLMMEQPGGGANGGNEYWLYTYNPNEFNAATGTYGVLSAVGNEGIGDVGSNLRVAGFGPLGTSGQDEMLMQDAAGDFEVYQYNGSALAGTSMGAVGPPWVVDGIADPPPSGASAASSAQLVQAMASFGPAGAPTSAPIPVTSEPSQQALLTTPHA